jgi:leader peptidase (prepilin peptidase) / N-methyltransferase
VDLLDPHLYAAVVAAVFGLTIGSFVGVVADRVPRKESVVKPGSHCVACGVPLRPVDNVPLFSYLILRGRCRSCGVKIPPRDLYVELLTALLFAGVAWRMPTFWAVPGYCVLAAGLVALSAIDLEHRLLPRTVIYPTAVAFGLLTVLASWQGHRLHDLIGALIGAGACFLGFALIWFVAPRAMGFGDVRLAGLCGAALGWLSLGSVAVGMFAGFLLAAVPSVWMLARGRATRKTAVAFGPFLALGTMVGVCFGPVIAHAWLSLS